MSECCLGNSLAFPLKKTIGVRNMSQQIVPPESSVSEQQCRQAGFTNSGLQRFTETVNDYSSTLFHRAVHLAEASRAGNVPREVTHEYVRAAAFSIAQSYGRPPKPKWLVPSQIGEYVGAAIAGGGAGYLNTPLGIVAFALGLSIAVVLIVIRLTRSERE